MAVKRRESAAAVAGKLLLMKAYPELAAGLPAG